MSKWGYRAYAIDIPMYENKSLPVYGDEAAVEWLTSLINALHLSNLVIISPSMSNRLTLPYILQLSKHQQLVRGFVPIAAAGTHKYHSSDYKTIGVS